MEGEAGARLKSRFRLMGTLSTIYKKYINGDVHKQTTGYSRGRIGGDRYKSKNGT